LSAFSTNVCTSKSGGIGSKEALGRAAGMLLTSGHHAEVASGTGSVGSQEQETPPRRRGEGNQGILRQISSDAQSRSLEERVSQRIRVVVDLAARRKLSEVRTRPRKRCSERPEAVTCCRELARTLQLSKVPRFIFPTHSHQSE
jgi:hypothetical protein